VNPSREVVSMCAQDILRMRVLPEKTFGKHRFRDLNSIIDRVHALFDAWENSDSFNHTIDDQILYRTKLAVHEWLANLVQHAEFNGRTPEISVEILPNGKSVRCVIEDNSNGFDLDAQLTARQEVLNAFPERGMGLLMIKSCTDVLDYEQIDHSRHRLEFVVTVNKDPWMSIPF